MRFFRFPASGRAASHAPDPTPPPAPANGLSNVRKFKNLKFFAEGVAEKNPAAIRGVIAAILRSEQSELILDVLENGPRGQQGLSGPAFFVGNLWDHFPKEELVPIERPQADYPLLLGRDTVLTHPWNDGKLINHISLTGRDKLDPRTGPVKGYLGPWTQDPNHSVVLWLPWRIGFVGNGYHSVAAGILAAEGSLLPTRVEDWSFLLDLMETDGIEYRDRRTKASLGPVTDVRRAAVFEIGRLIVQSTG